MHDDAPLLSLTVLLVLVAALLRWIRGVCVAGVWGDFAETWLLADEGSLSIASSGALIVAGLFVMNGAVLLDARRVLPVALSAPARRNAPWGRAHAPA